MPALSRGLVIALFGLGLSLTVVPPGLPDEPNTNRGGGDYTSMDLSVADPAACETACANDGRCRAWTYVQPGVQGPNARCWLKDVVPNPTADTCCVSGVKTPAFRSRWDKVSPGDPWTTGWVANVPRQMCAATVGCACGGANFCGEFPTGSVVVNWPNGCNAPSWELRCTSEPQ